MIGTSLQGVAPTFACPDQRRSRKHTIEGVHRRTVGKKHPHCICTARHCGAVECSHTIGIFYVWIEAALKHGFDDPAVATFSRNMHHEVMLRTKLIMEIRMFREHYFGTPPVAGCTGGNETLEW